MKRSVDHMNDQQTWKVFNATASPALGLPSTQPMPTKQSPSGLFLINVYYDDKIYSVRWKPRVVMMPTLSTLAAPQVVVATTCGAASDAKVVTMANLGFQWYDIVLFTWLHSEYDEGAGENPCCIIPAERVCRGYFREAGGYISICKVHGSTTLGIILWRRFLHCHSHHRVCDRHCQLDLDVRCVPFSKCSLLWRRMRLMASRIACVLTVCPTTPDWRQRKHHCSALLALCEGNPQAYDRRNPLTGDNNAESAHIADFIW